MTFRIFFKYLTMLTSVLLVAIGTISAAQSGKNEPAASMTFSETAYHLAWQSTPTEDYRKYEYLPTGQTLPNYQDMLLVERLSNGLTVAEVVHKQVEFLNQRKQTDPVVQHRLIRNEASDEYLLDFILSGETEDGTSIVEWNAYRYSAYQDADGKQGVQLYGYSTRGYGDEGGLTFLGDLKDKRTAIIQALASAHLPQFEGDRQ